MTRVLAVGLAASLVVGARVVLRPPAPRLSRTALEENPGTSIGRGRLLYQQYGCRTCHGPEGRGGFANPNAETDGKVPPLTHVAEGYTAAELRKRLLDGTPTIGKADKNGPRPPYRMPGWAGVLNDRQIDDLVAYLTSLKPKSTEPSWH